MSNLGIEHGYPWSVWLWFLILPLVALSLIFYFRVDKRHRRTRYRVVSLVLHLVVAVLAIAVLTGARFTYTIPYEENDIIIVVDTSYSMSWEQDRGTRGDGFFGTQEFWNSAQGRSERFVRSVLDANSDGTFRVAVVQFARAPQLISDFSTNASETYENFINGTRVLTADYFSPYRFDNTATNIADALMYASQLFDRPDASQKIILITDGRQTDGNAIAAAMLLNQMNIMLDIVRFHSGVLDNEVQINSVRLPERSITVGQQMYFNVELESTFSGPVYIRITNDANQPDEHERGDLQLVNITRGINNVSVPHTFNRAGNHQVLVEVESMVDTIGANNQYYLFVNLDMFDRLLILSHGNEHDSLVSVLVGRGSVVVPEGTAMPENGGIRVRNIADAPTTLLELTQYSQVILMNIARRDMPDGFEEILHEYVYVQGGGLLKIGGHTDGFANTWDRYDMRPNNRPSLYEQMLPVESVDFMPPLALVIVLDRSGSMNVIEGGQRRSRMEIARRAASLAVSMLDPRDYVGIVSFSHNARTDIGMTSVARAPEIISAIERIEAVGGTIYGEALRMSADLLVPKTTFENRHVMFITDGEPNNPLQEDAYPHIDTLRRNNISLSVISIRSDQMPAASDTGSRMVRRAGGSPDGTGEVRGMAVTIMSPELVDAVIADLNVAMVTQSNTMRFRTRMSDITHITQRPGCPEGSHFEAGQFPELWGFYGARVRNDQSVRVPLTGIYGVPIYAYWTFGRGRVGAFMSNLSGEFGSWGHQFVTSDVGQDLIYNIVQNQFPIHDVALRPIRIIPGTLIQDNRTVNLVLDVADLREGDTVAIMVNDRTGTDGTPDLLQGTFGILGRNRAPFQTRVADKSLGNPRTWFYMPYAGIYELIFTHRRANGDLVVEVIYHFTFRYSEEFNYFVPEYEISTRMSAMLGQRSSDMGGGNFITVDNAGNVVAINARGEVALEQNFAVSLLELAEIAISEVQHYTNRYWNPRVLFLILIISLFLLDIAARKFKFKWPWEIVRDRKIKREMQQRKKAMQGR